VPGGRARPATATLVTYIDEHKHLFGVEPICRTLTSFGRPIVSGTYRAAIRR
jgi:putative transposase